MVIFIHITDEYLYRYEDIAIILLHFLKMFILNTFTAVNGIPVVILIERVKFDTIKFFAKHLHGECKTSLKC